MAGQRHLVEYNSKLLYGFRRDNYGAASSTLPRSPARPFFIKPTSIVFPPALPLSVRYITGSVQVTKMLRIFRVNLADFQKKTFFSVIYKKNIKRLTLLLCLLTKTIIFARFSFVWTSWVTVVVTHSGIPLICRILADFPSLSLQMLVCVQRWYSN